jgi:phage-related protein
VSDSIANQIVVFLQMAGGEQAFYWEPPRASAQIAVICRVWRRQVVNRNANIIQATFEQVPELGLSAGAMGGTDWDDGGTIWD